MTESILKRDLDSNHYQTDGLCHSQLGASLNLSNPQQRIFICAYPPLEAFLAFSDHITCC